MLTDLWLVVFNLAQSPLIWMPALTAVLVWFGVLFLRPNQ